MSKPQAPSDSPAQWQQTDRLATIGSLTAGVAHELNNPIGYLLSNLTSFQLYMPIFEKYFEILRAIAAEDNQINRHALRQQLVELQQQEDLDFLLQDTKSLLADSLVGAMRVRNLVLDLRRFSHPDHAEFQLVELSPLLDMALRLTKNELKTYVRTEIICGPQPVWLLAQPAAFTQVLVNLLLNAGQAIGQANGMIQIRVSQTDNRILICIEDSGPGIADDVLPHIFTPFFTTKSAGNGTGLGLPICRSILQQHHGDISVSHAALGGAAFTIWLPAQATPADSVP